MTIDEIDLYEYFRLDRKGANGGYLTAYCRKDIAELRKRARPAMLVIPGGGYNMLSDREGEPVAIKYLNCGFTSFVLSYSVKTKYPVPLIEAMLAIVYIRRNAEKYGVDSNHVCAIGFSAGGHLAGLLASVKSREAALADFTVAQVLPNAVIFAYPVVSLNSYTHLDTRSNITGGDKALYDILSVERRVDVNSAAAFIWHTCEDDCVPVENSLTLANAYRRNKLPFALHVFEHGGHGLSLADNEVCDFSVTQSCLLNVSKWFDLSVDWLKARGFAVIK